MKKLSRNEMKMIKGGTPPADCCVHACGEDGSGDTALCGFTPIDSISAAQLIYAVTGQAYAECNGAVQWGDGYLTCDS